MAIPSEAPFLGERVETWRGASKLMVIDKMKRKSKFSRQLLSAVKMVEDYEAVGHQFKSDNRHQFFFDLISQREFKKNFIL